MPEDPLVAAEKIIADQARRIAAGAVMEDARLILMTNVAQEAPAGAFVLSHVSEKGPVYMASVCATTVQIAHTIYVRMTGQPRESIFDFMDPHDAEDEWPMSVAHEVARGMLGSKAEMLEGLKALTTFAETADHDVVGAVMVHLVAIAGELVSGLFEAVAIRMDLEVGEEEA
jgi:hypothetical protein